MVLRHRSARSVIAVAAALVALFAADPAVADPVAGSGPHPVIPASEPASEVAVVAPPGQTGHPVDDIVFAGVTGFLHRHGSADLLWTRYDTGATSVVSDLAGLGDKMIRSAGGDSIAIWAQVASHPAPGKVSVVNLADQDWQQWAPPTGYTVRAVYGATMLVSPTQTGVEADLRLVTVAGDGTSTSRPVSGLPADALINTGEPSGAIGGGRIVLGYSSAGVYDHALLDVASGTATYIPLSTPASDPVLISGDHVAGYQSATGVIHVFSITGLITGADTASRDVVLPTGVGSRLALVGDHIVASETKANTDTPALDFPVTGDGGATLLPAVAYQADAVVQATDGSALVVGGSGVSDWAVHRYLRASNGSLTDQAVLPLRDPLTNAGLTLSRGLLRHVQSGFLPTGGQHFLVQDHSLIPAGSGGTVPADRSWQLSDLAATCASGVRCVKMVDGNWYGPAYLGTAFAGEITVIEGTMSETVPGSGGSIVDASNDYVIVNTSSPASQYVIETEYGKVVHSGPVTGAALWYSTLWTATTTPGQLAAIDLVSGTTTETVSTGSGCVPNEVQATGTWLYWSCATGTAGLVNLQFDAAIPLPHLTGPAMLGDGYLVWHDNNAGTLEMLDFHTGQLSRRLPGVEPKFAPVTPLTLASLPQGPVIDDRNIDWTVDKYGGDVAYVAPDGAAHVIDTGVPPAPTTIGEEHVPSEVEVGPNVALQAEYLLSRPVASWTLNITHDLDQQTAFTASGGPTLEDVRVSWNGLLPSGAIPMDGAYTWALTAVPVGGGAARIAGTGRFHLYCGLPPFRSYDCSGLPALLAVKSGPGEAHWYSGTPDGALQDEMRTEEWPLGTAAGQFSAIVLFGDYNGDGRTDVLARDGAGVLHAYLGTDEFNFDRNRVKSITIGNGWNGYALAAPGDVNQDGQPDLLARDSTGRLWLYPGTGKGSFGTRTEVGPGWNIYNRIIGAGDLNGDGIGDVLGIDTTGYMWRYNGTGTGGFAGRVPVGPGWNGYNAIIGIGDLNLDGNNDLLARDGAGNLWEYPGYGEGGFAARIQEGTGFQEYQAIF